MTIPGTVADLEQWLSAKEGSRFEFKEAKTKFSFDELAKYCCALANEGGGKVILGVADARPRRVVGSAAFPQPEETLRSLIRKVPLRIDFEVIAHPDGRVLVFSVPPCPIGAPVTCDHVYWGRDGDSLVELSTERLRAMFAQAAHDFSADVCDGAALSDLEPKAIENMRARWIEKSKSATLASRTAGQLLRDAELIVDGGITNAALILLGKPGALARFLSQSEVVFEYRTSETSGPADFRQEFREGFFSFYDDAWNLVRVRNSVQHYQDGLFVVDVPTFEQRSVREALLNAVAHREYQLGGSIFVRQYQRRIRFESPGGFPVGITTENILDRQSPRNRRIAETLARCGLVERAGQGMNLMFEQSIRQGKHVPDFAGTDAYQVVVTLHGEVWDPKFVRFIEKIGREHLASFDTHDFLVLDLVHRDQPVPRELAPRRARMHDLGVLERKGHGRGVRYFLSRRFYGAIGQKGVYTRRKGLDLEESKAILLKHLVDAGPAGAPISELEQVLTSRSRDQIRNLLRELRNEGRARVQGQRRGARWTATEPEF